jgi:hypothetical protein
MTRRTSRLTLAAAATCLLPALAHSQLVTYDGFEEYPSGALIEDGPNGVSGTGLNGGFGWADAYDVNNAIKSLVRAENRAASPVIYSNGDLTIHGGDRALRFYDNAIGTYALRRAMASTWDATAGQELWASFLFRCNNTSPLANQDFLAMGFDDNPSAAGGNPRVSVGVNTTTNVFPPNQPFRFFARSTTTVANSAFAESPDIAASTTYLVVTRISASTRGNFDTVDLWLNPASATDPGPPSARIIADSGINRLTHWFIRTANLDSGDAYVIDELKIGRTYPAVIVAQPPPFALEIQPSADRSVELRWSSLLDATLESTNAPASGPWTPVPGPFESSGAWLSLRVPTTDRAFFRLRRRGQ